MTGKKLRICISDINNLESHLRMEVGKIISTWVPMRNLMAESRHGYPADPAEIIADSELCTLYVLVEKLADEIWARLSEFTTGFSAP